MNIWQLCSGGERIYGSGVGTCGSDFMPACVYHIVLIFNTCASMWFVLFEKFTMQTVYCTKHKLICYEFCYVDDICG